MQKIKFNIPLLTGREQIYLSDLLNNKGSGSAWYGDKCTEYLESLYGPGRVFLTASCSSALEIAAGLTGVGEGDEIIMPSFIYPTAAIPFVSRGVKIVFADCRADMPVIDGEAIEKAVTDRTRAVVVMHYSGVSPCMDRIREICLQHRLLLIEDVATSFNASYKDQMLGSIGDMACLSFHSSKNIQCIEGGALLINNDAFTQHVYPFLNKGTNKAEYDSGMVDRYEWVGTGLSHALSPLHAAYLLAQLEQHKEIISDRKERWQQYFDALKTLSDEGFFRLPHIPSYAGQNYHTFYLLIKDREEADTLRKYLVNKNIEAVVHYTALDKSRFWEGHSPGTEPCRMGVYYSDCLLRLPLYNSMEPAVVKHVVNTVTDYFKR